jgi:exonuclease SbcD
VLIAGDIYKNRTPNPTHQREFARRIGKLRSEGIPVFILTGNHDISPSLGRAHSVEIFNTLAIEGVTIADRPKLHRIHTRSGPVQVIAVPWITRHVLLTRDETRTASFSEIEAMLLQRLERYLHSVVSELDANVPTVLTMHGTVEGSQVGAERGMTLGHELVLPRSMVGLPAIDYVAMGHIHRHQSLGEHPPIVYAGSIERVDFGERKEDKGCVLVELEKQATRWQFHTLDARPFVSIDVDVRRSSTPQERITAAIQRHEVQGAVVRVEVQATHEQAMELREDRIRSELYEANAFLVSGIAVEVQRESRSRLAEGGQEMMDGLTPRRALELYFQAKQVAPERIGVLLAAADELLAEDHLAGEPGEPQ